MPTFSSLCIFASPEALHALNRSKHLNDNTFRSILFATCPGLPDLALILLVVGYIH